jgi:hypothetical protein
MVTNFSLYNVYNTLNVNQEFSVLCNPSVYVLVHRSRKSKEKNMRVALDRNMQMTRYVCRTLFISCLYLLRFLGFRIRHLHRTMVRWIKQGVIRTRCVLIQIQTSIAQRHFSLFFYPDARRCYQTSSVPRPSSP